MIRYIKDDTIRKIIRRMILSEVDRGTIQTAFKTAGLDDYGFGNDDIGEEEREILKKDDIEKIRKQNKPRSEKTRITIVNGSGKKIRCIIVEGSFVAGKGSKIAKICIPYNLKEEDPETENKELYGKLNKKVLTGSLKSVFNKSINDMTNEELKYVIPLLGVLIVELSNSENMKVKGLESSQIETILKNSTTTLREYQKIATKKYGTNA